MITLAVECSSDTASAALFTDDSIPIVRQWVQERRGADLLFSEIPSLLNEGTLGIGEVDIFVVGRGPGRFSSLRASLAFARAAALPSGKPVLAVSSGKALAWRTLQQTNAANVAVIGDARRDTWWVGAFSSIYGMPNQIMDWQTISPAHIKTLLPPDCTPLSPQYEHLASAFPSEVAAVTGWITGDQVPTAEDVGHLGIACFQQDLPPDPLIPIYLHPPVRHPV